jgi:hypothetical protein
VSNVAHDWLGNEIVKGARIIWRKTGWGIGVVTYVYPDKTHIDIEWEQRQNYRHSEFGECLSARNAMVWPGQELILSWKDEEGFSE